MRPQLSMFGRLRVFALGLLGYAFIVSSVLIALGFAAGAVALLVAMPRYSTVKIALFSCAGALAFASMVWSAMRVDAAEAPKGDRVLTRAQTPELFAVLDRLQQRLKAPPMEQVLLVSDDLNAAMIQQPRRGPFGARNYLVLGLPLLYALDVEQATSVIAHELGHASRNHGMAASWVYTLRQRWLLLMLALEENPSISNALFRLFLRWYAPMFERASFGLARDHEYEADAAAASVASATSVARGLCRSRVLGEWLREYMGALTARADVEPEPPRLYAELAERLREPPADADGRLATAMARASDDRDTHPSLRERLIALDREPDLSRGERTAAVEWLGDLLPELEDEWSARWQLEVGERWRRRHHAHARAERRLVHLDAKVDRTPAECMERAALLETVGRLEEATLEYRGCVRRNPEAAEAQLGLGRLLLAAGDHECVGHLERAAELSPEATHEVAILLVPWLYGRGRSEEASAWSERARQHAIRAEAARDEREHLRGSDRFKIANNPGLRAALETWRQANRDLGEMYFVEKVLAYPGPPFFVLAVDAPTGITGEDIAARGVFEAMPGPDDCWVIPLGPNPSLRVAITSVPGARL